METKTRQLSNYADLTKLERDLLHRQRQIVDVGSMTVGVRRLNGKVEQRTAERRWIKVGDDLTMRCKIKGAFVVVRPTRVTLPGGQTYLTFRVEEPNGAAKEPDA